MFGNLIVIYLFLGGGAAGLVSVLSILDILYGVSSKDPKQSQPTWTAQLSRRFFTRGYLAATVALVLGVACLLIDLGHPERFTYVLTHPTFSMLTFGSYALTATIVCSTALATISLFNLDRIAVPVLRVLEILSVLLGLCTMVYTGLFLTEIVFVELWHNPFLPALFTLSSLSIGMICALGLALLESEMRPTSLIGAIARTDAAIIAVEALCVVAFFAYSYWIQGYTQAVEYFLFGKEAELFWIGFVGLGIVLPLAIEAAYTKIGAPTWLALAVPSVVIGGFFLRYCIVNVALV